MDLHEVAVNTIGKDATALRLRLVREEIYGKDGVPSIARRLDLPPQTWLNYEGGVTIPGQVVLQFLELTGVDPLWLYRGNGARFRPINRDA